MLSPYKNLEFVLSDDDFPNLNPEVEMSWKHMRSSDSANTSSSLATNITAARNSSDSDKSLPKPVGARQLVGKTVE